MRLCSAGLYLVQIRVTTYRSSNSPPLPIHPLRQQALLAAISEKDANIALLELSASKKKKTQEEVMALKREKDRLMHQLKQQVRLSRCVTHVANQTRQANHALCLAGLA